MKNILFLYLFTAFPFFISAQSIYDSQQFYDSPFGLFDKDSLRTIYVEFEDPDYHNVLVDAFFNNPSLRIPATVTIDGVAHDSVGVRYKGNSTFCLPNDEANPKVPYNLDMNHWISGQKLMNYKKIKLANAWLDPTFAKEFSAAQIYRNYLPCPEVNLIKLDVQGDYLGLYVNTESVNKQFFEKHYNEKSGVLFKCDGAGVFCGGQTGGEPALRWMGADSTDYYTSYTIKSDYGWEQLLELINTLNFNPEELENILNIDRILWYFAVNQAISNLDTYNGYYVHNYYLYQTEDGLFQLVPWDLSESFVGAIMGWSYWSPEDVYEFDPYFGDNITDPNAARPLADYLLNHPLYRKQYTAHLRTVISEALDTAVIRNKIDELQTLAYDAADSDFNKAFNMSLYSLNVEEAIWTGWGFGGIMSTINVRKEYLLAHPEISLEPPVLENGLISNDLITVSVDDATEVVLMATTSEFNSKFQTFPMFDDGSNGDVADGDGIYSIVNPFAGSTETLKFYFRAQNDDALAVLPQRAAYEFYEWSSTTTAVNENELLSNTKVFPNPTNDYIFIETKNGQTQGFHLSTTTGKVLLTGTTQSNLHKLKLEGLSPGMYLLSVGEKMFKIMRVK